MSEERELVRVICQGARGDRLCRTVAAAIVIATDGVVVLRFTQRSDYMTSAQVASITADVERKLIDTAKLELRTLPPKLHRMVVNAVVEQMATQGIVDPTSEMEPVRHRGFFTTTIEREIATIENWEPIAVTCPRCDAALRVDGGEATRAISAARARHRGKPATVRAIPGHTRSKA